MFLVLLFSVACGRPGQTSAEHSASSASTATSARAIAAEPRTGEVPVPASDCPVVEGPTADEIVAATRLATRGFGAAMPKDSNDTQKDVPATAVSSWYCNDAEQDRT